MSTIILGGGIAGMLAAYALRWQRDVVLLEAAPKLGGNYLAGGLKYLHGSPEMAELLDELNIVYTKREPIGAVRLIDGIHPHPEWIRTMAHLDADFIQMKHWIKTRGTDAGYKGDCMNDPLGEPEVAFMCDLQEMMRRLVELVSRSTTVHLSCKLSSIGSRAARSDDGTLFWYDHLVPTIPIGSISNLTPHLKLPQGKTSRLMILNVHASKPEWDYMYTPLARHISRLSWSGRHVQAEVPLHDWQDDNEKLKQFVDEANELVPDATMVEIGPIIPGHLLPLPVQPSWPKNWHPLGRFAEWNSRATADKVLSRARRISEAIKG